MTSPSSLVDAQILYDAYCSAELAILSGQEYTIGGRQLRRADLADVIKGKEKAGATLQLIQTTGSNQARVTRVIPRD